MGMTREEFEDKATAYALGAMSLHEVRVFEDLISSFDEGEINDLNELERSVAALAFAAQPATPSSAVKEKLFAQISKESKKKVSEPESASLEHVETISLRKDEGEWMKFEKGIQIKFLFNDPVNKTVTSLMRLRPGSAIPRHKHSGFEQCYVVEGEMILGNDRYTAGDFFCAMPDTIHETITTETGGVILLVSPEHYQPV
jgi:quercetin dioxygenase-like cupin family protein